MSLIAEQSRLAKLVSYRSAESNTTPLSLAQEMVSKIPQEVIKNRDSKYLDPCAGTGTFLAALYERLVDYHGIGSSDHILNNQLYAHELTATNVKILKKVGFKNIERVDFLNTESEMKYDVVIGNPPYNEDKSSHSSRGSKSLYIPFTEKAMKQSKGSVLFVVPHTWMISFKKEAISLRTNMVEFGIESVTHAGKNVFGPDISVNPVIVNLKKGSSPVFKYKRPYLENGVEMISPELSIDTSLNQGFFPLVFDSDSERLARDMRVNRNSLKIKKGYVKVPKGYKGSEGSNELFVSSKTGVVKTDLNTDHPHTDLYKVNYAYLTGMQDPLYKEDLIRDLAIVGPGVAITDKNKYIPCSSKEEAELLYSQLSSEDTRKRLNCLSRGSSLENWMINSLPL